MLAGHCLRVLVLAETGRLDELRPALERIAPYAGQAVTYGTVDHLGCVDHFLACGYAALDDPRPAPSPSSTPARPSCSTRRLKCLPWRRRAEALLARLG